MRFDSAGRSGRRIPSLRSLAFAAIIAAAVQLAGIGSSSASNPNLDAEIQRATQLGAAQEFAAAESVLVRALQYQPGHPGALYSLATIQSWAGRFDESIVNFRRLLVLQPENVGLHLEIGRVLSWRGARTGSSKDLKAAADAYETYLRTDPTAVEAMKALAGIYLQLGWLDSADATLEAAVARAPDDPETIRLQAEVSESRGDDAKAVLLLDDYLAAHPLGLIPLRWNLGETLVRMGRLTEAEQAFREILKYSPLHVGALAWVGWIASWTNRSDLARDCFHRAEQIDPDDPMLLLARADEARSRGAWRQSARDYRHLLQIDPASQAAQSGLHTAGWQSGPVISTQAERSWPAIGLSREGSLAQLGTYLLDPLRIDLFVARWVFRQDGFDRIRRTDSGGALLYRPTGYLECQFRFWHTLADSAAGSRWDENWWSADLRFRARKVQAGIAGWRRPVEESSLTLIPGYDDRGLGMSLSYTPWQRLAMSVDASYAKRHGRFPVGYWNPYWERWVDLGFADDRSEHRRGGVQVSLSIPGLPSTALRYRMSVIDTKTDITLPYWTPQGYVRQTATLALGNPARGGVSLEAFGYRSNLDDDLGGGGRVRLKIPLGDRIELFALGQYETAGEESNWDSRSIQGGFRFR